MMDVQPLNANAIAEFEKRQADLRAKHDRLINDINEEHQLACKSAQVAMEHARRCGELLIEMKGQYQHGAWAEALRISCPGIAVRTAQAYMQVHRHWKEIQAAAKAQRVAYLPIRDALKVIAKPKVITHTEARTVMFGSGSQPAKARGQDDVQHGPDLLDAQQAPPPPFNPKDAFLPGEDDARGQDVQYGSAAGITDERYWRHLTGHESGCVICTAPLPPQKRARRRIFCTNACLQRAYRINMIEKSLAAGRNLLLDQVRGTHG